MSQNKNGLLMTMAVLSSVMSTDELIEKLEESISVYKEAKLLNNTDSISRAKSGLMFSVILLQGNLAEIDLSKISQDLEAIDIGRKITGHSKES